jgi:RHS repeat-associated protein
MGTKAHGGTFQLSGNVQNRPTGMAYDVAGNLMSYVSSTYTYDQENRLSSTAGMSYTYDGNGERVKSNTSTGAAVKRYWSMGGNTLAEGDGSGNLTAEYVYFGGERVARIDLSANTVHYYLSDHLGSTSIVASAAGAVEEESDYYPFGTEVVVTGGVNKYKFTGKERDQESGLDWFSPGRYYSLSLGRFVSTDPLNIPKLQLDPKKFVHIISNPQNWNAYSYSLNDPINKTDPDGFLTIIVPGTWNNHKEWDNSQFKEQVGKTFGEHPVVLNNDDMGNNKTDRSKAAESLRTLIVNHKFAPGEKLNIVAHSHGGNVVGQATQEGLAHKIDTLVTLGTPVRSDYKPNESQIGLHLNVYSNNDQVQQEGQTPFAPASRTMWAPARNLDASSQANGHSELWEKPGTWDKIVVPELKK